MGIHLGNPAADIVTISRFHPNHSNIQAISGDPKVVHAPGEYEIQGVYIRGFSTSAPTAGDQPENNGYVIQIEGLTLCHLGDLAGSLPGRVEQEFRAKDILFVPVGGGCALPPAEAAALVRHLQPRMVIPMHFAVEQLQLDLQGPEPFFRALGIRDPEPQSRVSVSRSSLPREQSVTLFQVTP